MSKVPQVTLAFWIMKICATTLGDLPSTMPNWRKANRPDRDYVPDGTGADGAAKTRT
ncbi:MAG TPA: hypothetical protein VG936_09440 [Lacunisphaera sp.]|nr:hypothetical protein [Lacunisphaera sp.]